MPTNLRKDQGQFPSGRNGTVHDLLERQGIVRIIPRMYVPIGRVRTGFARFCMCVSSDRTAFVLVTGYRSL
jgi:hypothetical protein